MNKILNEEQEDGHTEGRVDTLDKFSLPSKISRCYLSHRLFQRLHSSAF